MNPLSAAVTGTAKPALVAAEDFFMERGGVYSLIQTKELRAGHNGGRVRVRGVGDPGPRPGDLIGSFQATPAAPTDDQTAIGLWRVGQRGGGVQVHRENETQDDYVHSTTT